MLKYTPILNTTTNELDAVELVYDKFTQNLQIKSLKITNGQVRIFSVAGQQLTSARLQSDVTLLDVASYPQGVYLVHIETDQGSETQRFIKW